MVLQNQGNEALKTGLKHRKKFYFREAIAAYTKGINEKCGDSSIEATLLSNRAQVQLQLGNDRNALDDSLAALQLDADNLKVGPGETVEMHHGLSASLQANPSAL